jgi:hypothetical protein
VFLIVFLFWEEDPCCSSFFILSEGSVLLIVFGFGTGIPVAHGCFLWEVDPCCFSFFVLGGGSVLLIVFCFGTGGGSVLLIVFCFGTEFHAAHVFLFWDRDPCCSSYFVLGG